MRSLFRTLSWRYWMRHRARAVLLIVCIALGVATWAATSALERSVATACARAATPLAGNADLHVSSSDSGVVFELVGPLSRLPGVRKVQPLVIEPVVDKHPGVLL